MLSIIKSNFLQIWEIVSRCKLSLYMYKVGSYWSHSLIIIYYLTVLVTRYEKKMQKLENVISL